MTLRQGKKVELLFNEQAREVHKLKKQQKETTLLLPKGSKAGKREGTIVD